MELNQSASSPASLNERLAKIARMALIAIIAVIAGMLIAGRNNPFNSKPAHANNIAAAPGYLMLTLTPSAASTLYVTDTNKQVICGYSLTGDKLRLTSARKYDFDSDVFDGSIDAPKPLEGGNGLNRAETEVYSKSIKEIFEKQTVKPKK